MFIEEKLTVLQNSLCDILTALTNQQDKLERIAAVVEKMLPDTMSTQEIAATLGCHKVTVQKMFRTGVLTNVGKSKSMRATRDQVAAVLKGESTLPEDKPVQRKVNRGTALYASAPKRLK